MLLIVVAGAVVPRASMYWNAAADCMREGRNRSDVQVRMQNRSLSLLILIVLADHIAAYNMIGSWCDIVICL